MTTEPTITIHLAYDEELTLDSVKVWAADNPDDYRPVGKARIAACREALAKWDAEQDEGPWEARHDEWGSYVKNRVTWKSANYYPKDIWPDHAERAEADAKELNERDKPKPKPRRFVAVSYDGGWRVKDTERGLHNNPVVFPTGLYGDDAERFANICADALEAGREPQP